MCLKLFFKVYYDSSTCISLFSFLFDHENDQYNSKHYLSAVRCCVVCVCLFDFKFDTNSIPIPYINVCYIRSVKRVNKLFY